MIIDETWHREQVEYWNGKAGAYWAATSEAIDRAFLPFGEAAIKSARVAEGTRAIDVGCGAGATALALAAAVGPTGSVLAVDVSEPLLARAQERGAGVANITFLRADSAFYPFEEAYDLLFSRFGVMFFGEPVAAFANLRRALRSNGRLTFVCWRSFEDNEWSVVPFKVAAAIVGDPAPSPSDAPGPHAFGSASRIQSVLEGSGFGNITTQPFDADVVLSDSGIGGAVQFAMSRGPASRLLAGIDDDDVRQRVEETMTTTLRPYLKNERVSLRGATWIVQAQPR